jgi:hypothetical protein
MADDAKPSSPKGAKKPKSVKEPAPSVSTFRDVLDQSEPRPADTDMARGIKKNYAERLSNKIAVLVANRLRDTKQFPGILPNADGSGRESRAASGAHKKPKKTDVRYATADTGLELLVSVKTLSFRDAKNTESGVVLGRYTKNMVRNDHELRAEAMDHHERHPFAVLAALFFLPLSACDDGASDKSSFGHAVMTFRPRAGRQRPTDPHQVFERLFIGLYEHEGEKRGEVWFFDVMDKPPRRSRPKRIEPAPGEPRLGLLTLDEAVAEIVKSYGIRNRRYMDWADEEPAPLLESASAGDADGEDDEDDS